MTPPSSNRAPLAPAFLFPALDRRPASPEAPAPLPRPSLPSAARLRHARPITQCAAPGTAPAPLASPPVPAPPATPRRMEATLLDYFDVCSMGPLHASGPDTAPRTAQHSPIMSRLSGTLNAVSARFKGWLPRRLHEPTGPWGLMLDMLLSLFVAQGACRSVIDALPLEVVGEHRDAAPKGDLESFGVAAPVREGEKCAICLGCYEEGDVVRHLACNHAFHAECVDVWLERKSLCPICKADTC